MGTVRSRIIRLIAVVAIAGTFVVGGAGTAAAGGPTSALLASPYADAAVGLYYTDADYTQLQALLGGPDLPSGTSQPPSAAGSPYVTATWLIHDVSVWRIDRIFLVGDEVWIVSEMSGDGGPLTADGMYPGETGNAGAVWHRAGDPVALTALLTAHGLTPASTRSGADAGPDTGVAAVDAPLSGAGPARSAAESADSPSGWLWAIGGLVAGLLIGGVLVGTTMVRRATPRPEPASLPDTVRMQPID